MNNVPPDKPVLTPEQKQAQERIRQAAESLVAKLKSGEIDNVTPEEAQKNMNLLMGIFRKQIEFVRAQNQKKEDRLKAEEEKEIKKVKLNVDLDGLL